MTDAQSRLVALLTEELEDAGVEPGHAGELAKRQEARLSEAGVRLSEADDDDPDLADAYLKRQRRRDARIPNPLANIEWRDPSL